MSRKTADGVGDNILTFRVKILKGHGEEVKNDCRREIAVLGRDNLYNFAEAIVKSFGFYFDHCFDFRESPHSRKGELYEFFVDLGENPTAGAKSVKKTKIEQAFYQVGKKMIFYFDYGDSWYFEVEFIARQPAQPEMKYPVLLQSHGTAPDQYPPCEENLELKADFERIKSEILDKIRRTNEKWLGVFQKAQGDPDAETELLHLKLELQIAEAQALKELGRMGKKVKGAVEGREP